MAQVIQADLPINAGRQSKDFSSLCFLASANGNLIEMRAFLRAETALDSAAASGIAATARRLALRAEQGGFVQISAAAGAVEITSSQLRAALAGEDLELARRIRDQLRALEKQITNRLFETTDVPG
jgi:hypothetical protein